MGGGGAHLELVLEQVLLVGQLAVEAEEPLLVGCELLGCLLERDSMGVLSQMRCARGSSVTYGDVHLVLLVGIHCRGGDSRRAEWCVYGGGAC